MAVPKQVLIRWANSHFDLMGLLEESGLSNPYPGMKCFCPFHDDEAGGKMSAKVYKDALHCFSEARQYRPYNILRFLGYSDSQIEKTLRESGDPPEDLYLYEDARIDLRAPLAMEKSKFLKGEMSFRYYAEVVSKKMIYLLEKNYKG